MDASFLLEYPILPILFTLFVAIFIYKTYRKDKPKTENAKEAITMPCPKCGKQMGCRSEFWFCKDCKTKIDNDSSQKRS